MHTGWERFACYYWQAWHGDRIAAIKRALSRSPKNLHDQQTFTMWDAVGDMHPQCEC